MRQEGQEGREEVRQAVEIDRQLTRDVFVTRCPVHREETGSCKVNVVDHIWDCLGCGAHGTVEYIQRDDVGHPVRFILEFLT